MSDGTSSGQVTGVKTGKPLSQAELVRYAETTPCGAESTHRRYPDITGRRYGLGSMDAARIRQQVELATANAFLQAGSTAAGVAVAAAMAAERAVFAIGVERLD